MSYFYHVARGKSSGKHRLTRKGAEQPSDRSAPNCASQRCKTRVDGDSSRSEDQAFSAGALSSTVTLA